MIVRSRIDESYGTNIYSVRMAASAEWCSFTPLTYGSLKLTQRYLHFRWPWEVLPFFKILSVFAQLNSGVLLEREKHNKLRFTFILTARNNWSLKKQALRLDRVNLSFPQKIGSLFIEGSKLTFVDLFSLGKKTFPSVCFSYGMNLDAPFGR